ncbi:MAG: SRPBCC family protein [Phycisphaerae bacterium]|nr:SRPBCC family protein [Phycisphaerae bacterium]
MYRFHAEMTIAAPIEKVWAFHTDVGSLVRILPKEVHPQVLKLHERFEPGAELVVRMGLAYFYVQWHERIVEVEPPYRFVDEQVSGPFSAFRFVHEFQPIGKNQTRLIETAHYDLPWGPAGRLVDGLIVRRQARILHRHHAQVARRFLEAP